MNVKELAEKHNNYIIEQRRYFHQYPELSAEEYQTTKDIARELEAMGLKPVFFDGVQGCMAVVQGNKPGGCVLLRADIDGLAVKEETGLPFTSKNEGKMHACGHDSHIAMLLGAAKILLDMKDELCGSVKLLFQPAEEIAMGAKELIKQGVLDGVDAVYSSHVWGQLDAPGINIQYGERMASCDVFRLRIRGLASHGSAPQHGHDAIVAASAVIMAIQSIVSRANSPLNALVITIGTVKGGQRFNIIADKVELECTVRTFSREFRASIEKRLLDVASSTAAAYGCTAEIETEYGAGHSVSIGAVINDNAELVEIGRKAVADMYGEETLKDYEKITGSEDFGEYMEKVPGVFAFIGSGNSDVKGSCLSNHHEEYTVDEEILHRGAAVAARFALDVLSKKAENKA